MQKIYFRKNYITYLLMLAVLVLIVYLLLESRKRDQNIDKALKQIPYTPH